LPPGFLPQHILHCPDRGGLHVRPTVNGGLLLGSHDADLRFVREGDAAILAIKQDMFRRLSAHLKVDLTPLAGQASHVVGVRPVPGDGRPVAGFVQEDVYLLASHSGVTLGPRLAQIVAEEVAEPVLNDRLSNYRPTRCNLAA
jgi:glycine/D-amino acid oxidase-like deaminating enzyme